MDQDLAAARAYHEQSLAVAREAKADQRILFALLALADMGARLRDTATAGPLYSEALRVDRSVNHPSLVELALEGLAHVAAAEGRPARASRLRAMATAVTRPWIFARFVDIGGRRLYVRGEYAPSGDAITPPVPTVVLESGLGDGWSQWERVLPLIAPFAPIVAYSRAGLPPSDPGPLPRTSRLFAEDLHSLLAQVAHWGFAPPYVLVGHSFGCLSIRLYAAEYPADVVSIVLVDGAHEDGLEAVRRRQAERPRDEWETEDRWYRGDNPSEHVDVTGSMEQLLPVCVPPELSLTIVASKWTGANYRPWQDGKS